MLTIPTSLRSEIEAQAEAGYPNEICGFLVGAPGAEGRITRRIQQVRNAWSDSPEMRSAVVGQSESGPSQAEWESASDEKRFLIDPKEYAAIDADAHKSGLAIVGFYHSHPDHPAVPSRFDLDLAMPEQSYVIVSVRQGKACEFRSWTVPDFGAAFDEEEVTEPGEA